MKFGTFALNDAVGAYLAHATEAGPVRFKKGRRLNAADVDALRAAGHAVVAAAVLDADDVGEDDAASRIADALGFSGVERRPAATGRVNFHALASGLFSVDRALVDALNRLDPGLTLATLADFTRVEAGQLVATVKIIPFAIAGATLAAAITTVTGRAAFRVLPFRTQRVALIQTRLPGIKEGVLDKTVRVTADRLKRSDSRIVADIRCGHDEGAVAQALAKLGAGADLAVVFGASAMTDPADVIPAAIGLAGGVVERAGMPVDPGNLLVLGRIGAMPVIGAPGCARSPKENGFDWVLDRLVAGMEVTGDLIAGLGVGGLLMEIPTRPSPRERSPGRVGDIVIVVLAAGRSSRMGGANKLLATFDGVPLVRRTVERALASRAARVLVVTGHQAEAVGNALSGLRVDIRNNPEFAEGISGSIRAGVEGAGDPDGLMILLADMPEVETADIDRLLRAAHANPGAVVRAVHEGKRGNPVVLPRSLFAAISKLEGDAGARHLIETSGLPIVDVDFGPGAFVDVDTPDALAKAGGHFDTQLQQ